MDCNRAVDNRFLFLLQIVRILVLVGAVLSSCEAFLLSGNPAFTGNVRLSKEYAKKYSCFQGNSRCAVLQSRRQQSATPRFGTQMKLDLTKADPKDVRVLVAGSTGMLLLTTRSLHLMK
jgi:hypothetical protein